MARIARALNDAAIPCPSAADPGRNPHRSGNARTLHTVRAILGNPRYTRPSGLEPAAHRQRPGRPGEHRAGAPASAEVEPARGLGHLRPPPSRHRQRGRLHHGPGPGHRRGPGSLPGRFYLLAGLLRCGTCGRHMESCWSNGKPAYRCRHGPAPPGLTPPGPRTPTSARTRSCPACPPWPSSSARRPRPAAGHCARHPCGRGDRVSAGQPHHAYLRPGRPRPPCRNPRCAGFSGPGPSARRLAGEQATAVS